MSHKPFLNGAVEADRRTNLSFCEVLDCANLPLDGLNCWLNAAVAVSDWTLFVHDFGWDLGASFVFDVNDTRLSVALHL